MKSVIFRTPLLLFILTVSASLHALERIPGTRIALDPPEGFVLSHRFIGYTHEASYSSIMVNELPLPYLKAVEGFTKKGLASQGMTLIDKNKVTIGDQAAMLYHVSQKASGMLFYKWLLIFGNEHTTEMLVAAFPEQSTSQWADALKKTLLGSRWQKNAKTNPFEGLSYRIEEHGDLKIATKINTTLLLTRNGVKQDKANDAPYIAITPSFVQDWRTPGDTLAYTRKRLQQMTNLCAGPAITHEEKVSYDGLTGFQLQAECADNKSGVALAVLHTMIFSDEGYYLFLAVAREDDKTDYFPIFRNIVRSFKRD